jgi:hypothetical protein
VNGRITFPGKQPIAITNGSFRVTSADQITLGTQPGVLIAADGCITRKAPVVLNGSSAAVDLVYKSRPEARDCQS